MIVFNPVHILHIGANDGHEVDEYLSRYSSTLKSITFIECIPEAYQRLSDRLDKVRETTKTPVELIPIKALLSDKDGQLVDFHIATNEGMSSSMLPPNQENWKWNHVGFTGSIRLETITADTLVRQNILSKHYDTLVIDTQGSELKVLRGMTSILPSVQQVVSEYSKREFYKGGVLLPELLSFFDQAGFQAIYIPEDDHGDMILLRKT